MSKQNFGSDVVRRSNDGRARPNLRKKHLKKIIVGEKRGKICILEQLSFARAPTGTNGNRTCSSAASLMQDPKSANLT
jgi:hypothetical protein